MKKIILLIACLLIFDQAAFAYSTEYFYTLDVSHSEESRRVVNDIKDGGHQFIVTLPKRNGAEKSYGKVTVPDMDSFTGTLIVTPHGQEEPKEYKNFKMKLIIRKLTVINKRTKASYPVFVLKRNFFGSKDEKWEPWIGNAQYELSFQKSYKIGDKMVHPHFNDYLVYYKFPVPSERHKNLILEYHCSLIDEDGSSIEMEGKHALKLNVKKPGFFDTIP